MEFKDFKISQEMLETLTKIGYETPTPIQAQSLEFSLEGKDVLGKAATGTGKTASFLIPIIERIEHNGKLPSALILVPTRELALQIETSSKLLSNHCNVKTLCVYGGSDIRQQINKLKSGVDIVVGTPGRVLDLLKRKVLKFDNIQFAVLDEVDEMLNMGFLEDVENIFEKMPSTRQTFFFTATLPKKIESLSKALLNEPEIVKVKSSVATLDLIEQTYVVVKDSLKFHALMRFLYVDKPSQAIIFANTKNRVETIYKTLLKEGFAVERIHGDLSQDRRTETFNRFREKQLTILVATDVAARGIDVKEISHVYNVDMPQEMAYYVHRIGRTGRANQTGIARSFVTRRQSETYIRELQGLTKTKIQEMFAPSDEQVELAVSQYGMELLYHQMEVGTVDPIYFNLAKKLLASNSPTIIVATALQQLTPQRDIAFLSEKITAESSSRRNDRNRRSGQKDSRSRQSNRRSSDRSRSSRSESSSSGSSRRSSSSGSRSSKPRNSK